MTPVQIVARVRIGDVAEALGVMLDRSRRRGVASWRQGQNLSVAFDDGKNTWWDHARGEGGGVLCLIQRIRGGNRRSALEWLAAFAGVTLDGQSEPERRDWARRIRAARPEAEALVRWKYESLAALRFRRNRLMRIYHDAVRFVLSHDAGQCEARGDLRYELALTIGWTYWERVEQLDEQIDRLEAAPYSDLFKRFGVAS